MDSTAVNRPTDLKAKQADINRKLQFYGIATAFQNGKVPSNEQIDIALNSFLASQPIANPSKKLSAEGQALVADFRTVVEQAKYLVLTKNQGNVLQDFIWQSRSIDGSSIALPGAPVNKETAQQHGNQALEGLRTLGTLMISNGQFRKLLSDASLIVRDMAGDAATHAASQVKPSQEHMSQIDDAAPDNTWHDVPDLSTGNIKNQIKSKYGKQAPVTNSDVQDAIGDASQAANPNSSRDPADVAGLASQEQQQGINSGIDAQAGVQNGVGTLANRVSDNVPEATKAKGNKTIERTKSYLSEKLPVERRDQAVFRLKKMIVEIQGHSDYSQAITTLITLAETYASHASTVGKQSTSSIQGARGDDALKNAEADLKTLIERFANGTSTDDLFESINVIYRDAEKDPELKSWFKQIDAYIRKCLQQQGYILEDRATDEGNELYDRGNFLLRNRYRNHTDRVIDDIKYLTDQFDKDPQNKQFGQSVQKLFNDLGNDENGKPTFKPHLIKDLSQVIIPGILEHIHYVPIPRIEYSDPSIDAVVENLVIESDNLMPNTLEISNDNYFLWGRKKIANKNRNSVTLSVSGIQMDLRDVSYYVKKKQGFPSLTDIGVLDIFLGGSGFSFKMKLSTAEKSDRHNFFKVDMVNVDVKNFNIKVKQSKHKTLFGLVKPIMLKVIRPVLQKTLEKVIKEKFEELDALAYQIKQEADRAQQEIIEDPQSAPNIYSRYYTASRKQLLENKQKVKAVAADKKVNMTVTHHDSIFPDIKLPGGIATKATEYKELAMKGDKWESPVFRLGSASTSSDIPESANITRRDRAATNGKVTNGNTNGATHGAINGATNRATNGVGNSNSHAAGFSNQIDQAFSKSDTGAPALNGNSNGNTTRGLTNQPISAST